MIKTTKKGEININLPSDTITKIAGFFDRYAIWIIFIVLSGVSILSFYIYHKNGLAIAYNDARSHLDIGRRVVEGLKPGLAQLGSVWLPLPHLLMVPTIWNDFMWHSGLAGAIVSMISYVVTGLLIYKFMKELDVGLFGRYLGVAVFATNLNILYLQSTAMTELILIATMTAGSYELLKWAKTKNHLYMIRSAMWIMLSTLTRYDGWFLLFTAFLIVIAIAGEGWNFKRAEGLTITFSTLAGFGIALWLLWNLLIFKDPLYFALGPFSAKSQQDQLEAAGVLPTKHNLFYSIKFYFYAMVYNIGAFHVFLGLISSLIIWWDKKLSKNTKIAIITLYAPLFFNIIALYLGHSVLFIQGLSGNTWFNVRYGIMLAPSIAILIGYIADRLKNFQSVILGLLLFVTLFAYTSYDTVTIDDAKVGSSQKNVSEVSHWLNEHAKYESGFVLISAASHDAIIFSSGLPMSKFIHEGTGLYWESAVALPDKWARWIIMRTYDDNDMTYREIKNTEGFKRYDLIHSFPFADIYELKPEYLNTLNTKPVYNKQK